MSYGYLHRGLIVEFDATTGGYVVEIPTLAPTRRMGPYPSTVPNLTAGQRVVLASLGTSRDEMVIVGRVPGVAPSIGQIPGLQAALDAKADDTEITALDARLDTVEPLVSSHTSTLAAHTGELVSLDARLDVAEPAITTLTTRTTALETSSSVLDRDLYGDTYASLRRTEATNSISMANGTMYLTRVYARRAASVSVIRMCVSVAGVTGTCSVGLYAGSGQSNDNFALVRSGSIVLTAQGRVNHTLSSAYSIPDGTNLLVVLLPVSYTTAPQMAGRTGIAHWTMLNAASNTIASATKTAGTLPATINLTDGSWTINTITHMMWFALA